MSRPHISPALALIPPALPTSLALISPHDICADLAACPLRVFAGSQVLDMLDQTFNAVFDGLNREYKTELESVRAQHPFKDLRYKYPCLRFTYPEAMALLRKEGPAQLKMKIAACDDEAEKAKMLAKIDEVSKHGDLEDIGTEDEKLLGEVIARTHGQDFYIIDKFPAYVRPFYTMPDPTNPEMANAYDSTPPERGSNP